MPATRAHALRSEALAAAGIGESGCYVFRRGRATATAEQVSGAYGVGWCVGGSDLPIQNDGRFHGRHPHTRPCLDPLRGRPFASGDLARMRPQATVVLRRVVLVVVCGWSSIGVGSAGAAGVREFVLPDLHSSPEGIAAGADGNLWFADRTLAKIGRITTRGVVAEFPTASGAPLRIAAGPDGNLWYTVAESDRDIHQVGRITPAGVVTEFTTPTDQSFPNGITAGPDGNLWFTESGMSPPPGKVGRISPAGAGAEFETPTADGSPRGIAPGPDGNVWFTEARAGKIGRITPDGTITEFPIATANSAPEGIVTGPDGNLWFTEANGNKIGRMAPDGMMIAEYQVPSPRSGLFEIVVGSDRNLWFTEQDADRVGRITTAGAITEFPTPTPQSSPDGITPGPDGALWFTERDVHQIGRISVDAVPIPVLSDLVVSPTRWRLGPRLSSSRRAPVGTTISFRLSKPATASLEFSQPQPGRQVHGRCAKPTRRNAHNRRCTLQAPAGRLQTRARAGTNKVRFQGRLSRSKKLALGRYLLTATATDAAGNRSAPTTATFAIVRH